tara:strand:+ start:169 stop:1137 length:969 start_codon:yes stop_codon:yes gene_type:complete
MENENNENEDEETVFASFTSMEKGMKWEFVPKGVGTLLAAMYKTVADAACIVELFDHSHLLWDARKFLKSKMNYMFTRDNDNWWSTSQLGWKVSKYPMVCYHPHIYPRGKTAPLKNNQTCLIPAVAQIPHHAEGEGWTLLRTEIEWDLIQEALDNWEELKGAHLIKRDLRIVKELKSTMDYEMHEFVRSKNNIADDPVQLEKLMVQALNDKIGRATERGSHYFHDRDFNELNFIDYDTLKLKNATAFKDVDNEMIQSHIDRMNDESVSSVRKALDIVKKDVRAMRRKERKMAEAWLDLAGPTLEALRALETYYIEVEEDEEE